MLTIRALADTHGWLPEVEPCDILLIAGDVCPLDNHELWYQEQWLDTNFRSWLESIPAKHIVGIAGNHDFIFEKEPERISKMKLPWHYLQDSQVTVESKVIYGSPWVPNLRSWAFYANDDDLKKTWEAVPEDIDILVTHGPPFGFGDRARGYIAVGCRHLTTASIFRVAPKLHVYGHIHEGRGLWKVTHGELANVAMVDEEYRRIYQPVEFIWDIYERQLSDKANIT